MVSTYPAGVTTICGLVVDRAALHRLLAEVHNLGLPVVSVHFVGQVTDEKRRCQTAGSAAVERDPPPRDSGGTAPSNSVDDRHRGDVLRQGKRKRMSHPRDATSHQDWPDHLTVTRNSGVDFYYEQYRRLRDREESLLKERDSLRRENVALRSRLQAPTNTIVVLAIHNRAQQQPSKIAESPAARAVANMSPISDALLPTKLPTAKDGLTLRAVHE